MTVLAKDMAEARTLGERLAGLPEVRETRAIGDYLPAEQETKIDVIQTMALFLAPALSPGNQEGPPTVTENREALADVLARLQGLEAEAADTGLKQGAQRLIRAIEVLGGSGAGDAFIADLQ